MKPFRSKFVMTVPESLYQAVCERVGEDFAGSYMAGARLDGQYLHPRTLTGYSNMRWHRDFMALLNDLKITMVKPTPYPGEGDRMSADDLCRGIHKDRSA